MSGNQQGGGGGASQQQQSLAQNQAIVQAAEELGRSLQYNLEALTRTTAELNKQAAVQKGLVKSSDLLANKVGQSVKFAQDLTRLYDSELQTSDDLLLKKVMIGHHMKGDYAQLLTTYMLENDINDIHDKRLTDLIKELKHREHINDLATEERDLYEEIATKTLEIRREAEEYSGALKKVLATARAIGNDPKTMGAFMLTQGIEKLETFHEGFEELHKQGLSAGQAIEGQFKGMSMMSMLGLSDTKGALEGIVSEYGNVNALSRETVDALGQMAHHFGIGGAEAAKIHASLARMPGETAETAKHAMEHTGHMAELQGIAPGKIMKDMAENTGTMAKFSKGGAEGFGKAAIELHKMGVEIGTASKMAEGLLDFESSVNKQMEASVLLGKEINLDKARELALNGDLEGSAKEVLKNIGGAAELEKMNVVQKQALADATGMTVEELTKAADAAEEQNKYFGEGASAFDHMAGKAMEWGAGIGGFLKENGLLILSTLQYAQTLNLTKLKGYAAEAGQWAKRKAQWLWESTVGKLRGGGAGGGGDVAGAAGDAMKSSDKMKTGGGKGFKESMKGLAEGFKEMGVSGVLKGIVNTALAGPALLLAVPAIPFILFMGLTPLKMLEMNFQGLAKGLASMGTGKAAIGSLNLMLFALAAVVGLVGIPFMLFLMLGTLIGIGLQGLASGLSALANPMVAIGIGLLSLLALSLGASVMMMGIGIGIAAAGLSLMFKELANMPIENMLLMPIALQLMGVGLLALGVASLIAAPGLFFATLALAGFAAVLALMQPIMAMGGLQALADGLTAISESAGGLTQVGLAVMGIGAGLGMMALAGLAALPVIGALIGLAAVAPALSALGGVFGGGGGEKEEKMDTLITEIRELKAIMAQGGVINMDGRKVGDVLRLGMTSSTVR